MTSASVSVPPAFIRRTVTSAAEEALTDTPVVVINGARQVGKTTLVSKLRYPGSFEVVTLDDEASREAATLDPRAFIQRPVDTVVIDEAQLAPGLFRATKAEVDRDRRPGRFVLTGSSRLLAAPGLADALVGRVEIIDLHPLSQGELEGAVDSFTDRVFADPQALLHNGNLTRHQLIQRVLAGGFPEPLQRALRRRPAWFNSYVETLSRSTVGESGLEEIEKHAELPRVLRLCAARTGTELNVASISSELGLPSRATDGYLTLLSNAFVLLLLPAWSTNLSSKVVHRPKLLLTDSGLAAHLTGATVKSVDRPTGPLGPLLETFVANELRKQLTWAESGASMWHFRDRSGPEVDIVLEHPDGRIVGIEVKATSSPTSADLSGLRFLEKRLGDRFAFGALLTAAPEATPFGPKLAALPVSALWSA